MPDLKSLKSLAPLKSLTLPPSKSLTLPPSPTNGAGTATAVPAATAAQVVLQLDDELRERLERQRQIVASSQAAREFGVTVDIAMVARISLIRGLERMEGKRKAGAVETNVVESNVDSVGSIDPVDQAHEGLPAEGDLDVDYNEAGEVAPPEGWNKWNGQERIPSEQQDVHDYYIEKGLWRWWGKSGDQILHFYWSPKKSLNSVGVYESADPNGKNIMRQITPWGPGHILPKSWGLTPG